jgi:O-acetyl-ADP-ribose deacetylase (regulator of RNase III)
MWFFGRSKTVSQAAVTTRSTSTEQEPPSNKKEEPKILAVFQLENDITLSIVQGSLVDFDCPGRGAIVNATNERCVAGGGRIDGAITNAGGPRLSKDRGAIASFNGIRCPMGQARITGPGYYGSLKVNYVIHAVGPEYKSYKGNDFESLDNILRSAYQEALECCRETPEIEQVAFALLSAGVFRGKRGLRNVLQIGIHGIRDWASESDECGSLKQIFLFAFKLQEVDMLLDICKQELKPI